MMKVIKGMVLVSAILVLSGCLLNVKSDNYAASKNWHQSDLASLTVGETSTEVVENRLGSAHRTTKTRNGEIWEYRNRDRRETEVGFIFLFHIETSSERVDSLFVEFEDEILIDYWTKTDS